MADELNLEKTMELMAAAGIPESDCRMAYAGHGLTLKLEHLRDFAQAVRRAAPIAAQLDQDAERAALEAFPNLNSPHTSVNMRAGMDRVAYKAGYLAARRTEPVAVQLDAELPPPLTDEQIGQMYLSTRHIGHATNRELAFARAIEDKIRAPYAERIRLLEREMAEMRGANDQAWGICNAVADALGDDLDREAGSAESIRNLRRAYIDGRTAGTASDAAAEAVQQPAPAVKETEDPDPLYDKAVMIVRAHHRASISLVQRILLIGYIRAARLLKAMEVAGVVSTEDQNGHRTMLAAPSPQENTNG